MPSERKQFNVRMTDETAAKIERLRPLVSRVLGVALSQAQFFALAVAALEEKYGADDDEPATKSRATKGGKR